MKRAVLVVMCMLLFLSACGSDGSKDVSDSLSTSDENSIQGEESTTPTEPEIDPMEGFVPVFRFAVCSDVHLQSNTSKESERFAGLFKAAYSYSSGHEHYKTLDALVIAGDFTNNGNAGEYATYKKVVDENARDETEIITIMGNHEYYGGGGQAVYKENIDEETAKHVVVKGYHFIGVSPSGEDGYSQHSDWLMEQIKSAAEDDPDKPIITFQHHHIQNTVYTSNEWYTGDSAMFNSIYGSYSQVINFSGHSHGPINNPLSIWQSSYTLLGTGTLSYFEMASGMTYGTLPPNKDNAAQFYIVEADADNRVRILPYNLLTGEFFKTPSNIDSGEKQLVYAIDDLKDTDSFKYTRKRYEQATAPLFKDKAEIKIYDIRKNSLKIAIPQAGDAQCLNSYMIECTEKSSGSKKIFKYFSEYYFEPMPEELEFTLGGLEAGREYDVNVYAVNIYNKISENSLKTTVSMLEDVPVEYKSQNDVEYYGTFTNFDNLGSPKEATSNFVYGTKIDGDYFAGSWSGAGSDGNVFAGVEQGKGYKDSAALGIWASTNGNQGVYVFGTEENKNTVEFPETKYLRIWVDFTDIDFRKANFGLISKYGGLFTTDESDGRDDLYFWYMAEEDDRWQEYRHGSDGCFGTAQASSVYGFKGWMAFPVGDFTYRSGTGTENEGAGLAYPYDRIAGIYMFWDYSSESHANKKFYLDEIHLTDDYRSFKEYNQ